MRRAVMSFLLVVVMLVTSTGAVSPQVDPLAVDVVDSSSISLDFQAVSLSPDGSQITGVNGDGEFCLARVANPATAPCRSLGVPLSSANTALVPGADEHAYLLTIGVP